MSDTAWIWLSIILFWNFDNNKYDLYDLLYNFLIKLSGVQ